MMATTNVDNKDYNTAFTPKAKMDTAFKVGNGIVSIANFVIEIFAGQFQCNILAAVVTKTMA